MSIKSVIKTNTILWVVIVLETLIIGYFIFGNKTPIPQPEPVVIEVVRDSIIRDSIYIVNESIRTEIKYIKEQYTQDSVDIMSANDSVLFDSFARYIEDYNNQ